MAKKTSKKYTGASTSLGAKSSMPVSATMRPMGRSMVRRKGSAGARSGKC